MPALAARMKSAIAMCWIRCMAGRRSPARGVAPTCFPSRWPRGDRSMVDGRWSSMVVDGRRSPQRRPAAPARLLFVERLDQERAAALGHGAVARRLARKQARVPAHLVGVVAAKPGVAVDDDLGKCVVVLDD